MKTRLHRSEVRNQLGKLARCGGPNVSYRAVEAALGYPLVEASPEELRGIIAALTAVVDATCRAGEAWDALDQAMQPVLTTTEETP